MVSRRGALLRFQPSIDSGHVATAATARARPGRLTTPAILIAAVAAAAFVVFTPGIVGFGAALAAAIGWCQWLERRPG